MKFAVIVFPGSNCDEDMYHAIGDVLGEEVQYVSHNSESLDGFDAIILPGGFSYGDYLRSGAIAQFSKIMKALKQADDENKLILGVCNGFQILLECGLLPGAMVVNENLRFICKPSTLVVENNKSPFTSLFEQGEQISIPIAHGEGNYYCDSTTLDELKRDNRILFTYKDNPNGSVENIAGIMNKKGNILGMMPHPERAVEALIHHTDGLRLLQSIVNNWRENHAINV